MKLSLMLDKPRRVGTKEPVTVRLTVTNVSQQPFRDSFATSQAYDFLVMREGKEVWRWSADKGFLQVITPFALAAGESRHYRETWDQVDNQLKPCGTGEPLSVLSLLVPDSVIPAATRCPHKPRP